MKFSLNPKFLWKSLLLFKRKGLKNIFLGNKVNLNDNERKMIKLVKENPHVFRKGKFIKKDLIHKGKGFVYLIQNKNKTLLLFEGKVSITPGPDLYVYLSTKKDARKDLGEIINLGLLKGTRGSQLYIINKNIKYLDKYKSVVIYCKQFEELFTFATLK